MFRIIVSGHNEFAIGIQSALKLIYGEVEDIFFISFLEQDGIEGIQKKYEKHLDSKNILFLTDIVGGTPFTQAVLFRENHPDVCTFTIGGCNLAMCIEALSVRDSKLSLSEENLNSILEEGKDGIQLFSKTSNSQNEDETDGI